MLRDVYLHGHLGERFGEHFRLDVATAGECVRALATNFKGFVPALEQGSYELIRGKNDEASGLWLELDHVNAFKLGAAEFHIIPVIEGSRKGGGVIKTVLGVALVGAAVFFSGGTLAAALPASGLGLGMTYGSMALAGVALAVSGISTLLAGSKKVTSDQSSYLMSGPSNTSGQGGSVPLVYGIAMVGSHLVSAGLDVEDIPVGWDPTQGNTYVGTFDNETGQGVQYTSDPAVYTGTETVVTYADGSTSTNGSTSAK